MRRWEMTDPADVWMSSTTINCRSSVILGDRHRSVDWSQVVALENHHADILSDTGGAYEQIGPTSQDECLAAQFPQDGRGRRGRYVPHTNGARRAIGRDDRNGPRRRAGADQPDVHDHAGARARMEHVQGPAVRPDLRREHRLEDVYELSPRTHAGDG